MRRLFLYPLILLLLTSKLAFGAVAFDASGSGAAADGVITLSYNHTVTGSNTLLICSSSYQPSGSVDTISGITFNGVDLVYKSEQYTDITHAKVEMWYLFGAATGTHTVELTFTNNTNASTLDCDSFTGAGSLGSATISDDVATGGSCEVPGNGLCYDVGFNIMGDAGCDVRTPAHGGQTKRYDICSDVGLGFSVEHFSSTRSTSGAMSWDHDSGAFEGQIIVPINPVEITSVVRRKAMILP